MHGVGGVLGGSVNGGCTGGMVHGAFCRGYFVLATD